jgi:ribosomal-protein-alanine N-acetyltransferase
MMFTIEVTSELTTARLRLRAWRDDDFAPWLALNNDPEVMRYFPAKLDADQALAVMTRINTYIAEHGYGLWAVEVLGGAPFIGFCGIRQVPFAAHFTPAVEIGWRLAREAWGHGYATEGARAAMAYGFNTLALDEIVAMVVPENARSAAVCERLGMHRDHGADFDHPNIPEGTVSVGGFNARRHMLYRIRRPQP